jgi:transcriptional regulator with XRE-family HTH domain
MPEAEYNDALCQRVRELRQEKDWTIEQMADALGVPAERYRKYEVRSPLPQYLFERFAQLTGRDVHYIVTGKSAPASPRASQGIVRRNTLRRA